MQNQVFVVWLDNFNLFLKYTSLRKSPYENCNWTSFAALISETASSQLPFEHPICYSIDEDNSVYGILKEVIQNNLKHIPHYDYKENFELFSPPLVQDAKPFLKKFYPISLLDCNIGSNTDLKKILLEKIQPMMENWDYTYIILTVDINIYYRILKVYNFMKLYFIWSLVNSLTKLWVEFSQFIKFLYDSWYMASI